MLITTNKSVFKIIIIFTSLLAISNAYADSEDNSWTNEFKSLTKKYIVTQDFQMGVDHWFVPSKVHNDVLLNSTESGKYSPAIPWGKYTGTFKPFANNRSN
jgi:hypothetical protein